MKKDNKWFKNNQIERHHKKQRVNGGTNSPSNISLIRSNIHTAWHILKGRNTEQELVDFINEKLIDPDFFLILKKRETWFLFLFSINKKLYE